MRRAFDLAVQGWGQTAPNPMVGAVVVRDGVVVGEGFHARYGGDHAEVVALKAAGHQARGATLYVSLEPCRHHGKTPPCTDAILAAGISRVVIGALDPTREARGGAALLRSAGVEVTDGVLTSDARSVDPAFFHAAKSDLPWTVLKLAVSTERAIAPERGKSTWLTGPEARAEVHRMRAGSDAIAVGVGTVLADDPRLTVRDWQQPRVPPVRVVFDRQIRTPDSAALVTTANEVPTIVVTPEANVARAGELRRRGVHVLGAGSIHDALRALRAWRNESRPGGIRSLLIEGGARIAVAALEAGVVHRIAIFQTPVSLGPNALQAFEGASPELMDELQRLPVLERRQVGRDTLTLYQLAEP
jgi:diaminohydroxyphosphoribosylaminopyrimidine deaminase / 5-amino-6-(5-phosphoribosylamino)uracil reductase